MADCCIVEWSIAYIELTLILTIRFISFPYALIRITTFHILLSCKLDRITNIKDEFTIKYKNIILYL